MQFIKNKDIFFTGATGFIGKVLLNRIISSSQGLGKMYLLIKPEKNYNPDTATDEFLSSPCFNNIRARNDYEEIRRKIKLIPGDITQERLGMPDKDYNSVAKDAKIFINLGANIKWDAQIDSILDTNYKSVDGILKLAKEAKADHLVHISSWAVVPHFNKFTKMNIDYREYSEKLKSLDQEAVAKETDYVKKTFGNTYVFAKICSEKVLEKERENVPVTVIRGTSIGPSLYEPYPGWVDKLTGYTSNYFFIAAGKSNAYLVSKNSISNEYPVDVFSNYAALAIDTYGGRNQYTVFDLPFLHDKSVYDCMKIAEEYLFTHPQTPKSFFRPFYFHDEGEYNDYIEHEKKRNLSPEEAHRLQKTIYFNKLYRGSNFARSRADFEFEWEEHKKLARFQTHNCKIEVPNFNMSNYVKIQCDGLLRYYLKKENI